MARVRPIEVKDIIDTSLGNNDISAFITAANLIVTDIVGNSTDLSDAQKKEIERWLTAHLIACTREPQAIEQKVDEASVKYQGKTGKGLESTHYGQMCLVLDTTGAMAKADKRKVSLTAVTSFE